MSKKVKTVAFPGGPVIITDTETGERWIVNGTGYAYPMEPLKKEQDERDGGDA